MSPRMFKSKMGKGETEGSASYKPGVAEVDQRFLTRFLREFFGADIPAKYETLGMIYHDSTRLAERLLESGRTEDFNPQAFLDELINRMVTEGRPDRGRKSIFTHPEFLFDPLLQALYNQGDNGLRVDATKLEQRVTSSTGKSLEGTEDELLTYEYTGDLQACGEDAKYCHITSHRPVTKVGYGAEKSVFRINAVLSGWSWAPKDEPRFFSGILAENPNRSLMLEARFWRMGNSLYLPNKEGEWELVTELNRVKI